ncbi:ABC transporter permease [Streptomyces sp. NBC_01476]|uniref:ABC transporter permease n=1 Tax=Streptomyces sp. NBC_01476 TaxID=2903881 RepID=UPI002E332983|nr:ABC transporter permease [Streptomyces sp. NBC_01476]
MSALRTARAELPHAHRPVRLSPGDILRLGLIGVRVRRMRAALSALGISIGIATMIVVTGIPASSQQALLTRLTALGTNMLQAQPRGNQDPPVLLPPSADAMARRIGPVTDASAVANTHRTVQRNDRSDPSDSVGISVLAARDGLLPAINGSVHTGRFLSPATDRFPTVVLGHQAASWLGFRELPPGQPAPQVFIDHRWFTVIGILNPMPLTPDLEQSVLVGWPAATTYLHFDGHPTVVYLKAAEDSLEDVRAVLPATLYPKLPGLIQVGRPSDALAAKRATEQTFSGLFLGLAGVALLVGGIGVANTMIISVLERRREIGLRRALGANRGQIRGQFLTEAVILSAFGGVAGAVIGALGVVGYASFQGWPSVIPLSSVAEGIGGALLVGVIAGVYPSLRAARLTPTEALATT